MPMPQPRLSLPALALALAASLAVPASAQDAALAEGSVPTIEVTENAIASRPADGALLAMDLRAEGETRIRATETFAALLDRIELGALQLEGAEEVVIRTDQLRSFARRPRGCTRRGAGGLEEDCSPVGYLVTAEFTVEVAPAQAAGPLIAWLTEAGADGVMLKEWTVEDPHALESEAAAAAVSKALAKAERVARTGGLSLGEVRLMSDQRRNAGQSAFLSSVTVSAQVRDPGAPLTRPTVDLNVRVPTVERTGTIRIEVETLPAED